jgi:hypothetical protein
MSNTATGVRDEFLKENEVLDSLCGEHQSTLVTKGQQMQREVSVVDAAIIGCWSLRHWFPR